MTVIQPRRGTAAQWTAANPVLSTGESGFETDTRKWKYGDGATAWNSLAYSTGGGEPPITGGSTSQYWRGDKTFQTLDKTAAGLPLVDNTSDATKNSATAALSNKDLTAGTNTFPTFNQNTTGSAAKLTTPRNINGVAFDGTANITVTDSTKLATSAVVDNSDGTITVGSVTGMEPLTPAAAILTASTAPAIGQITLYNATSGNLTPTLPALSGIAAGRRLAVGRDPADTSINTVTVNTNGADTFYSSGTTSFTLPLAGERREFQVVSVSSVKYWVPSGSLNPLPGLDARYAAAGLELYQDFTTAANGAPTKADSGQPWTLTNSRSGATPTITGGRLVDPDTASGPTSSYLTAQLAATATYFEADFDFLAAGSTAGEAVTFGVWATNLPSGTIVTVPNSPGHVTFTPTNWTYAVWSGGAITNVLTHTYLTPFTTQTQHAEFVIDKANSMAYVRGPDNVVVPVAHSLIGSTSAQYAFCEPFMTAGNTDNRPEIQKFGASSKSVRDFDQHINRGRKLLLDGQAFTPWRSSVATNTTSTTTVSTTAFANTTIPGLSTAIFQAPPSGKVVARYSCNLNVTTASLVYMTANLTGASSIVVTDQIQDSSIPAGIRRVAIEQVITGLTVGGNYQVTGQIAAGTASAASIQIGANKGAYLVVEPVY